MRRTVKLTAAAAAVLATIFFALRTPLGRAQSSSAANAVPAASGTRIARATSGPSGVMAIAGDASMNAPAIAGNLSVRALAANAFEPEAAAANSAEPEADHPSLLLTSADEADRVLSLAAMKLSSVAGTGQKGSLGDGGAAAAAQFDLKFDSLIERSGIAIAADGAIFVADTHNSTIRRIAGAKSSEPGIIRGVAGRFAPAQNVSLDEPLGIAVDRAGDFFIADRGANAVFLLHSALDLAAGKMELLAHVIAPSSVAVTQDGGKVFAASAETGNVFAIDAATRSIRQLTAFAPAASSASKDLLSNNARGIVPAGLAVDQLGNLFISDAAQNRILRIDAFTERPAIVARNFIAPGALAFDAAGNLYAADQGRNQIVIIANPLGAACVAGPGAISLCPGALVFGNEPTGGATPSQLLTVMNTSASALSGLTIATTGSDPNDFAAPSSTCLNSLPANSSCTVNVAFSPTATGARSASLTASDSNPADSTSAALSGVGDDFQIELASGQLQSVNVVAGATATFNLQIVPDKVFSGTVTIVCPSNLPTDSAGAATVVCNAPSPIAVTAGTAAKFTITFETTSSKGVLGFLAPFRGAPGGTPRDGSRTRRQFVTALAALLLILGAIAFASRTGTTCCAPTKHAHLVRRGTACRARRARARRVAFASCTLLLLLSAGALTGCKKGLTIINGTPPGTTNFLIQGASQNASRGFVVTMVVQSI